MEPRGPNKRLLGKTYGLANSKKLWAFRNRLYLFKYINACWLNQFLTSYFQSGGNMNETMHKWLEDSFAWIMKQTMGLPRVPGYEEIKKFSYNLMKAKSLINMTKDDIKRDTYFSEELNDKLYELFSTCLQIDPLRKDKLDNSYGCGLLHFEEAERRLDVLTHFFKWFNCIKKKSFLKAQDYETLIELVNEYEKDKLLINNNNQYDDTDDEDQYKINEPSIIAQTMIDDIINNEETLNHWMKRTKYRVNEKQLTDFINDYWKGQESDDGDDEASSSDDEDNILINGMEIPINDQQEHKQDHDDDGDFEDMNNDNDKCNDSNNKRGTKFRTIHPLL